MAVLMSTFTTISLGVNGRQMDLWKGRGRLTQELRRLVVVVLVGAVALRVPIRGSGQGPPKR